MATSKKLSNGTRKPKSSLGQSSGHSLSTAQRRYLTFGLRQAGGKLPLFDGEGQKIPAKTITACMKAGWCEPWYENPVKPSWLVCKLTDRGRSILG